MSTQSYRLYLGPNQTLTIELRTNEPIYKIIEQLIEQYQLPITDSHGQPIRYALYAGQSRRMSTEMSLRQAGYDQGGDLYLANLFAPWWETSPALTRRLDDAPAPARPARAIPFALIGMIAAGVVVIAVVAALLLVGRPSPSAIATEPTPNTPTPASATATLAPAPTLEALPTQVPTLAQVNTEPTSTPGAELVIVTPTTLAASDPRPTVPAGLVGTPDPETNSTPTLASSRVIPARNLITVSGVLREYRNRDERLFFVGKSSFGAYLWSSPDLQAKVPASSGDVVISNGDQIELLGQSNGIFHIRVATNAIDAADPQVIGASGYLPNWLVTNEAVPTPRPLPPTPTPDTRKLRMRVLNYDDQPGCISIRIVGISTSGWTFSADGTNVGGRFDNAGNARLCGLGADQEVTISIKGKNGRVVAGGGGVPSKGRAIMYAEWR